MKSNFEEKREARAEKYTELAAKNVQISEDKFKEVNQLSNLMNGQPILIGHHSEKRHRRDIEKMHNKMGQSVEADRKAKYYEARAESLLSNNAIFSDDPNAIDKLQDKVEKLEARQELYKQCNKIIKGKKPDAEKVASLQEIGLSESRAMKLLQPDYCGRIGFPSYVLTNNNAVINNAKKRIQYLEQIAKVPDSEEVIYGVTIKVSQEDNRVQIFFPGKPSEEVRTDLKKAGFHWSPSIEAWMKQIGHYTYDQAKSIVLNHYQHKTKSI